jgi:hypothetical protein
MTLRPQYSLINSEFNEFLFAPVGEEKNGIELTVLSALTRLGLDPWREAARLSSLPREAAARALAAAIATLPEGDWLVSDCRVIAARLVDRLPGRSAPAAQSSRSARSWELKMTSRTAMWLFCLALAVVVLFAVMHRIANQESEAVPSAASSTQR